MSRRTVLFGLLILLAACDGRMDRQAKLKPYGGSALFPDGAAMQAPPAGSVARDEPAFERALATRPPMSMALLRRGQQRFDIYCAPCHARTGDGDGMIVQRGFPHPPSLHDPRLRNAPDQHFLDVIAHGYGAMYAYGDRVAPADRWAIVAYIRALQASRNVDVAALPPEVRDRLEDEGSP